MVFKSNETIASLYEGITKQAVPSADQLVRQAPKLNKTELSKDYDMLQEAYKSVGSKCTCMHAAKGCDCAGCDECEANQEPIEEKAAKPDYLDIDKDGNKKEPLKKAVKDKSKKTMKENMSFKDLFNMIMTEGEYKPDLSTKAPISGPLEHDKQVLMLRRLSNGEIHDINDEEQYVVTWKNPEQHNNQREQSLKGEYVHSFLDKITSIRRAFPEE